MKRRERERDREKEKKKRDRERGGRDMQRYISAEGIDDYDYNII